MYNPNQKQAYYQANKDRILDYQKTRYQRIKDSPELKKRLRKNSLSRFYGLSEEGFDELLVSQENKCAICGNEFTGEDRMTSPQVDHNHETSKVRGLLCQRCNIGLSYLEDQEFLVKAMRYLEWAF